MRNVWIRNSFFLYVKQQYKLAAGAVVLIAVRMLNSGIFANISINRYIQHCINYQLLFR